MTYLAHIINLNRINEIFYSYSFQIMFFNIIYISWPHFSNKWAAGGGYSIISMEKFQFQFSENRVALKLFDTGTMNVIDNVINTKLLPPNCSQIVYYPIFFTVEQRKNAQYPYPGSICHSMREQYLEMFAHLLDKTFKILNDDRPVFYK